MTTVYGRYAAHGLDTPTGDDWRDQSLCRSYDAELFFPLGGPIQSRTGANLAQERAAKAICNRCPVRVQCLQDALRSGDEYGVWGGLNEAERRELSGPKPATGRNFAAANAARVAEQGGMCRKGLHEVTPENTYTHDGYTTCAPCRIEGQRQYRKRRAAARRAVAS